MMYNCSGKDYTVGNGDIIYMRTNYHTHTYRCRHASGSEKQYVKNAIATGFEELGFSDHCPWPFDDGYESTMRMRPDEFRGYLETVRGLGERYAREINIYCGLECEYYPAMLPWMQELKEKNNLDYLILGNHFDTDERTGMYFGSVTTVGGLHGYADRTTKGMMTGMFVYLAHPDLCFRAYHKFDADCIAVSRELCKCAHELNMPLEFNLQGVRYKRQGGCPGLGYPCEKFWEIAAQEDNKCIIGIDAHQAERLSETDVYDGAAGYLASLGIERIEKLPLDR